MTEQNCDALRYGERVDAPAPDRRDRHDRRRTTLRTFVRGGFTPRRRGARRADEHHSLVDWHDARLLFPAMTILLLSVTDAFLTVTLLTHGAYEANPFLAYMLDAFPSLFAAIKVTLTGIGVLVLVAVARTRVFRVIRAGTVMHWFLIGYVALIGYEWWLLRAIL